MSRSKRQRLLRREGAIAIAFLAPAVAMLVFLRLLPLAEGLNTSFQAWKFGDSGFVGLENYARILQDPTFVNALVVTLVFALIVNPFQIVIALLLAVLLNQRLPLVGLWRSLVFLPAAIPQSVSAVIWLILFRPDGPLNAIFEAVGLPPQPFITSSSQSLFSIVLVVSWVGVGFWMMFLIAGLNDIPQELYEAADVDGAGPLRRFFSITIPQLRRPLLFVLVADTVANFLIFAPVQILTKGGPADSTNLIMYEIFNRAFSTGDSTGASAGTILLICVIVVIVSIQFRLLPGKD
ncbi:sugar ABC transporter permease [Leifsonia bigeumensis]|uniref:Sugar ABC transporter permease n=1 Tax=Leifsonella bigeumensis TaxID=433643 RepID=A0ABP7F1A6_9MICO